MSEWTRAGPVALTIEWCLVDFLREPSPGEALITGCPHGQIFYLLLLPLWPPGAVLFYDFIAAVRADNNPSEAQRAGFLHQWLWSQGSKESGLRFGWQMWSPLRLSGSLPLYPESGFPDVPGVVLMTFLLRLLTPAGWQKAQGG